MAFAVGVLASGEGSNLQALLDRAHGRDGVEIAAVGSDKPDARALERGRTAGVPTAVFERGAYPDRATRDTAIAGWLKERGVELVVLAGYMQLVSPDFLRAFPQRVINVHPALLPAFPGLRAIEQALAYGVRVTGATVHLVDDGVDTGPIILQQAIGVPPGADAAAVRELLRPIEHDLLCTAVQLAAAGRLRIDPSAPRQVGIEAPPGAAQLDHAQVTIPPGGEDVARGFYGELLGLREIAKPVPMRPTGGVWFALGAQQLHIGVEDPHTPARKAHPGIRLADPAAVDALADRCAAAGHEPEWDHRYPGQYRCYVRDPFGNRVELMAAGTGRWSPR